MRIRDRRRSNADKLGDCRARAEEWRGKAIRYQLAGNHPAARAARRTAAAWARSARYYASLVRREDRDRRHKERAQG